MLVACLTRPGAPPRVQVAQLREEVQRRGLKTQGTKQVLLAKLSEALEREVAAALGGEQRLAQWAANAVGRLGEQEVVAELSVRGVRADQYPTPEAAAAALQAVMHRDWVAEALHGGQQQAQAGPDEDGEWAAGGVDGDAYGEGGEGGDGAGMGGGGGGDLYGGPYGGVEAARAWVWGRAGDPTLALSLLVGGHTHVQRDAALAAARLAAQLLQSDRSHGLLPRQQLELGAGGWDGWAERSSGRPQSAAIGLPTCLHVCFWLFACLWPSHMKRAP